MLIYAENEPFKGKIDFTDADATARYVDHFGNLLFLEAVSKSPKNFAERKQAEKEMEIARRKMRFWERHPNYDRDASIKACSELKKLWRER